MYNYMLPLTQRGQKVDLYLVTQQTNSTIVVEVLINIRYKKNTSKFLLDSIVIVNSY